MKKFLFIVPIIVLLAAGCNSSTTTQPTTDQTQPAQQQVAQSPTPTPTPTPVQTTPTPTPTPTQTLNTYTNSKYGYSIKYPNGWYIYTDSANNDVFCGGPGNTDCYGGSLDISNVSNLSDYNGSHDQPQKTPPANFAVLEISVLPANSTMRNSPSTFCNSQSETNPVIKNITINGLSGQTCTAYGNDMPTGNIKVTYVNGQTYQYSFNYRPNSMENLGNLPASVTAAMDTMVNSFSAK